MEYWGGPGLYVCDVMQLEMESPLNRAQASFSIWLMCRESVVLFQNGLKLGCLAKSECIKAIIFVYASEHWPDLH